MQSAAPKAPKKAPSMLVLSHNVIVGYQAARLLGARGWQATVMHDAGEAHDFIGSSKVQGIAVDIDSDGLDGLGFVRHSRQRHPSIICYTICRQIDDARITLLRELGCTGFFTLKEGMLEIDCRRVLGSDYRRASGASCLSAIPSGHGRQRGYRLS